ncbi:hypothetical protein [Candidatus Nitrosocosmicus sp. SS]|nr:hypothetical protein [Candidatus Nitrosocosmicus sp. SS]
MSSAIPSLSLSGLRSLALGLGLWLFPPAGPLPAGLFPVPPPAGPLPAGF